jgi:hypothetical protein
MDQAWLQQRPHLAPLARTLDAVLKLADEQYEQGRANGDAVDYAEFEERVAHATAKIEQDVHQVALSGLDLDVPFIRSGANIIGECIAPNERTVRSADQSSSSARCIASSDNAKARY